MKVSIGKELIFVREWLKSKGLQGLVIKGWSICRKKVTVADFAFYKKKLTTESSFVGANVEASY